MKATKIIILATIIGLGIAYVFAWSGPPGTPPSPNADAPINVGALSQYKTGALGIGGLFETDTETHLGTLPGSKVGIGTTNPSDTLDVNGTIRGDHVFVDRHNFLYWDPLWTTSSITFVDIPNTSKNVTMPAGTAVLIWEMSARSASGVGDYLVRICIDTDCSYNINPLISSGVNETFGGSWSTGVTAGTKTIKLQVRKCTGCASGNFLVGSDDYMNWTIMVFRN